MILSILSVVQTLKLIYKTKLEKNYDINFDDLYDEINNIIINDDNENMNGDFSDELEEENETLGYIELDETSNKPVIIKPYKYNLCKKIKKINYNELLRKSQNISKDILQKSQPAANFHLIIKRLNQNEESEVLSTARNN
ncbi:6695_t:CDS:2 [Funneliformis mosseae]|uniref:6695_t:CDS:1 n=1 Tax=Funneliformis mosseae TaxID=27381 RepID=A0A9N9GU33_FUNMO|nr:6695_t:CDS:2 [Funneliformis mosseae]